MRAAGDLHESTDGLTGGWGNPTLQRMLINEGVSERAGARREDLEHLL